MRLGGIIIVSALIVFLGSQIYTFWGREGAVKKSYSDYVVKLDKAKIDEKKFQDELRYYANKANLEKELRQQFDYKAPGEKLIIIVPKNQSSTGN